MKWRATDESDSTAYSNKKKYLETTPSLKKHLQFLSSTKKVELKED